MSAIILNAVTPLARLPSLLPLARALLDAIGLVGVALPTEEEFAVEMEQRCVAGDLRVSISRRFPGIDPYAGGASDTQSLQVEGPGDRRLWVGIDEVAWVGPELVVRAKLPPVWAEPVAAAIAAFLAEHERRRPMASS